MYIYTYIDRVWIIIMGYIYIYIHIIYIRGLEGISSRVNQLEGANYLASKV